MQQGHVDGTSYSIFLSEARGARIGRWAPSFGGLVMGLGPMGLASMPVYTGILVPPNPLLFYMPTVSSAACKLHAPNFLQLKCYSQFRPGNLVSSESYSKEDNVEEEYRSGYGGLKFKGTMPDGTPKSRLDAWVVGQLQEMSRACIQSSVHQGLVQINGHPVNKASHVIHGGDIVSCTVSTFRILQEPLRSFSQLLIVAAQAVVSLRRLEKYLHSDEVNAKVVEKISD